jgi:hypothetical protein
MVQMANPYHVGSSEGRAAISPKEKPRRYMRGFQTGCTREGHPKGSLFECALRRWHAAIGHSNFGGGFIVRWPANASSPRIVMR